MKIIETKIYRCEYCDKKYSISAGVIGRHEKWCKMNPKNHHQCFDFCKYLQREKVRVDGDYDYGEMITPPYSYTTFFCEKKKIYLKSYLSEKPNVKRFHTHLKDLTLMPNKCGDFSYMYDTEDNNYKLPDDFYIL